MSWLKSMKFNFKQQVRFKDCKLIRPLPFDFGVYDCNNELVALIEYDGEQHFSPKECFGGIEEFEKVKLRDKTKTEYCLNNGINLIRISYTQLNNIETILLERATNLFDGIVSVNEAQSEAIKEAIAKEV